LTVPKPTARPKNASSKPARQAAEAAAPQAQAWDTSDDAGIRVLCVDDHAVLVEGLVRQFAIEDRIRVVGRLGSAEKLLDEATRLRPDVVMFDIEMPGPDIFEMADRLRHMHPRMRFVFLSAHIRDGYLAAAYKCGAWGYFAKGDDLSDIVAGVTEVARSAAGTFVMGPKVRERCRPARGPVGVEQKKGLGNTIEPVTPLSALSNREVEVLRLIGKGLSRVEIAKELSRSAKTIDGHQEHIMKKLGIESRTELMRFAIREGFAEA
jgi:DNA-binding NarL/FixJ family response regulator